MTIKLVEWDIYHPITRKKYAARYLELYQQLTSLDKQFDTLVSRDIPRDDDLLDAHVRHEDKLYLIVPTEITQILPQHVLGVIVIFRADKEYYKDIVYCINTLVIDQQHRGKGYGRQAMELILKEIKKLKGKGVILGVFSKNTTAVGLYQSLGFEPYSLRMSKKL
jgi:ribosomal protein S18 acetylase RimI-like enzyme